MEMLNLISQEIKSWSKEILEKPIPLFANMPPCPFARKAWLDKHVQVHVVKNLDQIIYIKNRLSPQDETVHVVAWTNWQATTKEQFEDWLDRKNKNHFGIWLMGFHPEAEDLEEISEFEGIVEDDYALILVQSLDHLVEASNKLMRTKYYDTSCKEDMNYINQRKEVHHAWKIKNNEEAYEKR
tara:strand:+ start:423 stop:971 length:549 start_codon:yes stop_codon:yes gene_type:complete